MVRVLRRPGLGVDPDGKKPADFQLRLTEYPQDPVVFVIADYYGGLCNGIDGCDAAAQQQVLDAGDLEGRPDRAGRVRDRGRRSVEPAGRRRRERQQAAAAEA